MWAELSATRGELVPYTGTDLHSRSSSHRPQGIRRSAPSLHFAGQRGLAVRAYPIQPQHGSGKVIIQRWPSGMAFRGGRRGAAEGTA